MNRIYFFSGTGNSLDAAEKIGKALPGCEIIAVTKHTCTEIPAGYERLGFVFPNYAGGPPSLIADFIRSMNIPEQGDTYLFAVATYGGNAGGLIPLTARQFKDRGLQLNYGAQIWSYPNWLPPSPKVFSFINRKTIKQTESLIADILRKEHRSIPALKASARMRYDKFMESIHDSDKKYRISGSCISCGICGAVCPAKNISLENGRPAFHHNCESCMACMNYCPRQAIHTGKKEQKRRRYTHPQAEHKRIMKYYEKS
ncbi:EFR1 family ferrodoxin [Treponema sp. OttesenSCG-928-L16]|nr:EFR1 family ferrodoxin [Treponema sp. OttesenSCG-928-L16]